MNEDEIEGPVGVGKSLKGVKLNCLKCGNSRLLSWMFSCACCFGNFCVDTCVGEDRCFCQECDEHQKEHDDPMEGVYCCAKHGKKK